MLGICSSFRQISIARPIYIFNVPLHRTCQYFSLVIESDTLTYINFKAVDSSSVNLFKHPLSVACTKSDSKCGFIIRYSIQEDNHTSKLCTDEDDYADTGIHLHDVISTRDMYRYVTFTGTCEGKQITVAGRWMWWEYWLPHITDLKFTMDHMIAYNLSDYLVAKRN